MKTPCKFWSGAHDTRSGRPRLGDALVHRLAYEAKHGPIPAGLVLHHNCFNPRCVNVDHLEAMTQSEHTRRHAGGAHNAVKTHCPQGHAYTEENTYTNTYIGKHGGAQHRRHCKTCMAARKAAKRTK